MAKGLKVGDTVTVRKELRLPRKDPAYKAGLKRLRPGEIGRIVANAEGRSVVVEFEGKQVTLASQRLDYVKQAAGVAAPVKPRGKPAHEEEMAPAGTARPEPNLIDYVNTNDPQFIRGVANKLLRVGDDPEAVIVQIRLTDLPARVQDEVRGLIAKKLDLGPQLPVTPSAPRGARRGRKPKNAAS